MHSMRADTCLRFDITMKDQATITPRSSERSSRHGPGSVIAGILLSVLVALPVLLAIAAAIYFILGPAEGYYTADWSDSLYWANASYESGRIFDPTYRYAALLPFSAQLWMTPLVALFGFTMTAQNIGMIIFVLVFCASLWYFCRSADMSIGWCSLTTGVTLMILSSSEKLREIMLGHVIYYSLGLVLFFLITGLSLSISKRAKALMALPSDEKKPQGKSLMLAVFFVLLLVVSAGSATDGVQMLVLATLPALGGIAAERLFCGKTRLFSRDNLPTIAALVTIVIGTIAGLILLKLWTRDGISASYTNVYSTYSDMSAWKDNALKLPTEFLKLLGISASRGDALFDSDSIANILRIALAAVLTVCPIVMLLLYRKLCYRGTRVMLWGHLINSAAIIFGYICGNIGNSNWRLTPMVGSAAVLTMFAARELSHAGRARLLAAGELTATEDDAFIIEEHCPAQSTDTALGRVELRGGLIFVAFLCVAALVSFGEIMKLPADYGRNNEMHEIAEFLEENDLEYGYATFWRSNLITLISDSNVKTREILDTALNRGIYTDYYQSSKRWYDESEHEKYDKYFVLLSQSEYKKVCTTDSWQEIVDRCELLDTLEHEGWYVFVFAHDLDLNATGIDWK